MNSSSLTQTEMGRSLKMNGQLYTSVAESIDTNDLNSLMNFHSLRSRHLDD